MAERLGGLVNGSEHAGAGPHGGAVRQGAGPPSGDASGGAVRDQRRSSSRSRRQTPVAPAPVGDGVSSSSTLLHSTAADAANARGRGGRRQRRRSEVRATERADAWEARCSARRKARLLDVLPLLRQWAERQGHASAPAPVVAAPHDEPAPAAVAGPRSDAAHTREGAPAGTARGGVPRPRGRRGRAVSPGERAARARAEDPTVAAAAEEEWAGFERREAARCEADLAAEHGAAAVYAAGGSGASEDEVFARVQAALERGDFGRGAAARDLAWRSFSSAQAFLHGGRDEVEAPWTTLGRPPAEAGAARFGLGFDAASRV